MKIDNETKQYISSIEARVQRLEAILSGVACLVGDTCDIRCTVCGMYDPLNADLQCPKKDCPHGMNPNDDE